MRGIGGSGKVAATDLLLCQVSQAVFHLLQCPQDRGFVAARRLLLPFVLHDEVLAELSAIEQPCAGRGAGVPELRARHEQRGERQRFEPDRSGKPEARIEIRARDIHLRELRRQLSFCAPHIRTTAKRVGRQAECGLDRCLGDGSRRGEFRIQLGRRAPEKNRNRVNGLSD